MLTHNLIGLHGRGVLRASALLTRPIALRNGVNELRLVRIQWPVLACPLPNSSVYMWTYLSAYDLFGIYNQRYLLSSPLALRSAYAGHWQDSHAAKTPSLQQQPDVWRAYLKVSRLHRLDCTHRSSFDARRPGTPPPWPPWPPAAPLPEACWALLHRPPLARLAPPLLPLAAHITSWLLQSLHAAIGGLTVSSSRARSSDATLQNQLGHNAVACKRLSPVMLSSDRRTTLYTQVKLQH